MSLVWLLKKGGRSWRRTANNCNSPKSQAQTGPDVVSLPEQIHMALGTWTATTGLANVCPFYLCLESRSGIVCICIIHFFAVHNTHFCPRAILTMLEEIWAFETSYRTSHWFTLLWPFLGIAECVNFQSWDQSYSTWDQGIYLIMNQVSTQLWDLLVYMSDHPNLLTWWKAGVSCWDTVGLWLGDILQRCQRREYTLAFIRFQSISIILKQKQEARVSL